MSDASLYGPKQSRFARLLERRESRRPDPVASELRRRLLGGQHVCDGRHDAVVFDPRLFVGGGDAEAAAEAVGGELAAFDRSVDRFTGEADALGDLFRGAERRSFCAHDGA